MESEQFSYEIILIDDASNDTSWEKILELGKGNKSIIGFNFLKILDNTVQIFVVFGIAKMTLLLLWMMIYRILLRRFQN